MIAYTNNNIFYLDNLTFVIPHFYKVVTSAGSSPFSEILIARTQYNFTELDRLKESMVKSTEASFQELGKNVTSKLNTLDSSMSRRLQNVFIQLRRFESFFLPYVGKKSLNAQILLR